MHRYIRLTLAIALFSAISVVTYTAYTQQRTIRQILNSVWDRSNHQLMTTPWAGAQGPFENETAIYNDVYDSANHMLRTSGGGSGGGGGAGYSTVQEEGVSLAQRSTLNFTGTGVTCSDSGGKTVCDVPSSSGTSIWFNVKDAGAVGDGTTDDSDAVAALVDSVPDGSTIYFPTGTYIVNFGENRFNTRDKLTFRGEGQGSVLKRGDTAGHDADFPLAIGNSSNITIRDMAFDMNHCLHFCGVRLEGTIGAAILNNYFFDSNVNATNFDDKFGIVITGVNTEILVINNLIVDLQLEADQVNRGKIIGNTIIRPRYTAGIGLFSQASGSIHTSVIIAENIIIDAQVSTAAIELGLDPTGNINVTYSDISIVNNTIISTSADVTPRRSIQIGSPSDITATTGNVFKDILVQGNNITMLASGAADSAGIFIRNRPVVNLTLQNIMVSNNSIVMPNNAGSYGILADTFTGCTITNNVIRNVVSGSYGLGVARPLASRITGNTVYGANGNFPYFFVFDTASNPLYGQNTHVYGNTQIGSTSAVYTFADSPHSSFRYDSGIVWNVPDTTVCSGDVNGGKLTVDSNRDIICLPDVGGGGGGGAPTNAHYLTTQAEGSLSAEFNLGSLTSGMLKHAVSSGVSTPATATPGTDYCAPSSSCAGYQATLGVTDDTVLVGNGTVLQNKTLPGCTDTAGNHLNYDSSTNTFSCGTSSSGGGGGSGTISTGINGRVPIYTAATTIDDTAGITADATDFLSTRRKIQAVSVSSGTLNCTAWIWPVDLSINNVTYTLPLASTTACGEFEVDIIAVTGGRTLTIAPTPPDTINLVAASTVPLTGVNKGFRISLRSRGTPGDWKVVTGKPTVDLTDLTDLTASSKLVGAGASSAAVVEISLGSGLSMSGNTISANVSGTTTTYSNTDHTIDATDNETVMLCDSGSSNRTFTLPAANAGSCSPSCRHAFLIKNTTGSGRCDLAPAGTNTLNGVNSTAQSATLQWSGYEYRELGAGGWYVTSIEPSVLLSQLAALSGTSKLLGSNASSTSVTELTLGSGLSISGSTLNGSYSTASSTDTLTNKTLDAEATGNVITLPSDIPLPGAGCNNATASSFWDLPTTTPAVAACVTGTNIQKGVMQFADTTGGFSMQMTFPLPARWTTTNGVDFDIVWRTSATTGNVKWTVQFVCTAVAATATDDPAFPTSGSGFNTVTTAAPGTANRLQVSTVTGATLPSSCVTATREMLHIRVFRDGNDAADTIAATAEFVSMMLTIRRAM